MSILYTSSHSRIPTVQMFFVISLWKLPQLGRDVLFVRPTSTECWKAANHTRPLTECSIVLQHADLFSGLVLSVLIAKRSSCRAPDRRLSPCKGESSKSNAMFRSSGPPGARGYTPTDIMRQGNVCHVQVRTDASLGEGIDSSVPVSQTRRFSES